MTLVSAIIPTYRRPEFVEGAVETALAQTHEEIEVVIVCDPPVEETRATLERFADDERVRPFYNDERLGIPESRNRAVEHAKGEYICILDDDDRWHPEKVERQLAVMESNPDCGVVYTGGLMRRGDRFVGSYEPSLSGDIFPEVIASFDLKPYSAHMIRAECFETVGGYDPSFDRGEDWDHTIRVAREYEFEYVADPLVVRHHHGGNVSSGFETEDLDRSALDLDDATDLVGRIWNKYREDLDDRPDLERRLKYGRNVAYGWSEIERNNRFQALRHGWEATKTSPTVTSMALLVLACLGPFALETIRHVRYSTRHPRLSRSSRSQL